MIYVFKGGVIEVEEHLVEADCKYGKWRIAEGRAEWSVDGPPPPVDWRVPQGLDIGFRLIAEYLLSACEYSWRGGERAVVALVGPPGSGKTTYFRRLLGRLHDGAATVGVESALVYVEGRPVVLYDLPGHRELFILPERVDGALIFSPLDELLLEEVVWYLLAAGAKVAVVVGTKADVGRVEFLTDYAEYFKSAGVNIIAGYAVVTPNEPRWKLAEILTTIIHVL